MNQRGGGSGGFAQSMAFSAARGGILIAVAIVIGLVLLQVVDSSGSDGGDVDVSVTTPSSISQPSDGSDGTSDVTDPPPTETTLSPSEIRVLVLNGTDPDQPLAGTTTEELRVAGYQMVAPNDTDPRTGTIVACKDGFTEDATPLAAAVGETAVVEPFPETPPLNAENVAVYDCLVVLGS